MLATFAYDETVYSVRCGFGPSTFYLESETTNSARFSDAPPRHGSVSLPTGGWGRGAPAVRPCVPEPKHSDFDRPVLTPTVVRFLRPAAAVVNAPDLCPDDGGRARRARVPHVARAGRAPDRPGQPAVRAERRRAADRPVRGGRRAGGHHRVDRADHAGAHVVRRVRGAVGPPVPAAGQVLQDQAHVRGGLLAVPRRLQGGHAAVQRPRPGDVFRNQRRRPSSSPAATAAAAAAAAEAVERLERGGGRVTTTDFAPALSITRLSRLPSPTRALLTPLDVCRGGGNLTAV